MKLFAVKDLKAEGYSAPFVQATYGLAERSFRDACQDKESQLSKYPQDFQLFHIGDFIQATGELLPNAPKLVIEGSQLTN